MIAFKLLLVPMKLQILSISIARKGWSKSKRGLYSRSAGIYFFAQAVEKNGFFKSFVYVSTNNIKGGTMGLLSWLTGGSKQSQPAFKVSSTGKYLFEIVGESHYQSALEKICEGRSGESQSKKATATIVHEDDNPYDNEAIRVDINGLTVGYLSKNDARKYRQALKIMGKAGATATCPALIVGGWDRGGKDKGGVGVKLDLPAN